MHLLWFALQKIRLKCAENASFPQFGSCNMGAISARQSREGFIAAGMTQTNLVRHLAEKTELNNKTAAAFLEHLADTAIKETKKNGVFIVPGLGRLVKAHRKARVGRNPQT